MSGECLLPRRDDPATAGLPLVAVTGYGRVDQRTRAVDGGFDQNLDLTNLVDFERPDGILADPSWRNRSA